MQTKLIRLDPRRIRLLELNARYMRHETFSRMVENIKKDGTLTQTPFGWALRDDNHKKHPLIENPVYPGEPWYEVLSGNHRVKAAIAADLPEIDFQVTDDYLEPDERAGLQLSHNAIAGEDDPAVLKTINENIQDVGMKIYTGLDDKTLQLLQNVKIASLSEANLTFQNISMTFLPHEAEQLNTVWEAARKAGAGAKGYWLVRYQDYDRVMDTLDAAASAYGVKNIATAMMLVLEIFTRHIADLTEGFLDEDGEAVDKKRNVPIAAILGNDMIPASLAADLKKALAAQKAETPMLALQKLIPVSAQTNEHIQVNNEKKQNGSNDRQPKARQKTK